MINIVVIGCGYWGINLVRNIEQLHDSLLYGCCDLNPNNLGKVKKSYPHTKIDDDYHNFLTDSEVEAVLIATSANTHYKVAKDCLRSGKHTFVEKPMTLSLVEAEELRDIANTQGKILMVGHLLEYHPAVEKLRGYLDQGELGDIYYIYSQRLNLGRVRKDENALWSLAPHDISMILYLLDRPTPSLVTARGACYIQDGIEDIAFLDLYFPDNKMAHIQVSWLDPHKIRKLTVVGSRKMAVFDDMEPMEKVKIYDKGVADGLNYTSYGEALSLRFGDIYIPKINSTEPLKKECQHFLDCIKENKQPRSDGEDGVRVVRILEAAQRSIKNKGKIIEFD